MLEELSCKCEVIKNFVPSWFASVMGTGILALVTLFYSEFIPIMAVISKWLFYFNVVLFVILLIPWILRWVLFTKNAVADLRHPVLTNFFPKERLKQICQREKPLICALPDQEKEDEFY